MRSARFGGCRLSRRQYTTVATLKVILARIGNQCNSLRDGVMLFLLCNPVTTWARVFWTCWSLSRLDSDIPACSALYLQYTKDFLFWKRDRVVLGIGSCQVTVRGVKEILCDSPLLSRVGAVIEGPIHAVGDLNNGTKSRAACRPGSWTAALQSYFLGGQTPRQRC